MTVVKNYLPILIFLTLLLACSLSTPEPTATPVPTQTPAPPSATAPPTATPTPTEPPPTPTHTATPSKTPTPAPTATPTMPAYPGRIVFTGFAEGSIDLFVADVADHSVERLTDNDEEASVFPLWSPDGTKIAYLSFNFEEGQVGVGLVDLASDGAISLIVRDIGTASFNLSWAQDNRYLLYNGPQPNGGGNDVYRLDSTNGTLTNLTANSPNWDAFPKYSPAAGLIAFVSDRADNGQGSDNIWVMNANGGALSNLTPNDEYFWEDTHPGWSPDGAQIAFFRSGLFSSASDPGGPAGLWRVDVQSGEESLIIPLDEAFFGAEPIWSPDGTRIAYQIREPDAGAIWIVEVATGDTIRVAAFPGDNFYTSWSPDSQAIVFTNENDDLIRIYIAAADGSGLWPLFPKAGNGYAHWSPQP